MPALTPAQTIGPFHHFALPAADGPYVVAEHTPDAIWVHGRIVDGAGEPVADALVETWQADADGRFDHPNAPAWAAGAAGFRGFARVATDAEGSYAICTRKPGVLAPPGGVVHAPHLDMAIFARGLLDRLVTRVYFADETEANDGDPVLATIEEERRSTLVATPDERGYRFDVALQGERETVFFAL